MWLEYEDDQYNWWRNSDDSSMSAPHRAKLYRKWLFWVAETHCNCFVQNATKKEVFRKKFFLKKNAIKFLDDFVAEHSY